MNKEHGKPPWLNENNDDEGNENKTQTAFNSFAPNTLNTVKEAGERPPSRILPVFRLSATRVSPVSHPCLTCQPPAIDPGTYATVASRNGGAA